MAELLAPQRQASILEEVERAGGVRVSDLTRRLGVSDMTVRRDLDALARRGLVDKVHGGATVARRERSTDEPGFEAKSRREMTEKQAIGRLAATLVEPGTAIAISAGTTTHALAHHLLGVPGLTVVTNSVRVAEVFHEEPRPDRSVILTGGLRTPSDALVGPVAIATIRSLHVDAVFMGVHGMDERAGFTSPNLMEAETNRELVGAARRLVVLADHTKWGVLGLSRIVELRAASVLVTDTGLSAQAREAVSAQVGHLLLADPERPAVALPAPPRPEPAAQTHP